MENNLIGKRFGRLKVLGLAPPDKQKNRQYMCFCDCGNYKIIRKKFLIKNLTRSCGCLYKNKFGGFGKLRRKKDESVF